MSSEVKMTRLLVCLSLFFFLFSSNGAVSSPLPAKVREYRTERVTYPFSDPDPVFNSQLYPYFLYEGYSVNPEKKDWTVVELENDYLVVKIYPEIGGKIWAATDKKTGKSFLFDNPVVMFRNIALRGPWTSGGLEANFGIIGHSPHCSTPVDYCHRSNPDGSASCFISHLDLITRTSWTVEINLPADSACFSTKVFWHNESWYQQPYYTWMNLGVGASDGWQTINPGTNTLGHQGEVSTWPIGENGLDVSYYKNNTFGGDHSNHLFGKLAESFGFYDHAQDYGMAAYIPAEDKRGRKLFLWGLSDAGLIWERLLTVPPGTQYIELQSGRLFIQNAESSSKTPFKHRNFSPLAVDCWEEFWMPVGPIGGFVTASPYGSMNVKTVADAQGSRLDILISPVRPLTGKLEILDGEKIIRSFNVTLTPLETY